MMGQRWSDVVRVGRISLVGSLDYRSEFACQVRSLILRERPDVICVEAPVALREQIVTAVKRLPFHSVIIYGNDNDQYMGFIIEGSDGILEAVRSGTELGISIWFLDPLARNRLGASDKVPDAYSIDQVGQKTFLEGLLGLSMTARHDPTNSSRELFIAARLQEAARTYERVLFVGNLLTINLVANLLDEPHAIPLIKLESAKAALVAPLHPDTLKKGFTDIPRITEAYEDWRQDQETEFPPNRHEQIISLMKEAIEYYAKQTRQEIPEYVRMTWARFLRKWLKAERMILPDLFHLVISARSSMDEDLAYHVHEFLSGYAWENDPNDPAAVQLDEDSLHYYGHTITLHKKLRSLFKGPNRRYRLKAVNSRKWKDHLKEKWETSDPDEIDICSFPPEDVLIEKWGETLSKHATHLMQTSQSHTEPFVADIGGGVDVRETLRRFYENRIYVKSHEEVSLDFGSVVIIFDEDPERDKFPFEMTWLGEHSQESDMAFYSTPPGRDVVGPGISRMEHGGFVLSYPPLRMYDVWKDPTFTFAPTRHERLLVAGIAYSEKPGIVYAARKPPASRWKKLAKSMGRRVVYIPLGSLNPIHVSKMRTFHMLKNKGVRNYANEYLKS
ncbi:MAG: hypothetical protein M0T73_04150 [Deltaproteobacteria bacterium]|nr:hypothetical protein [Deltaproteobacteria bacterium]